MIAKFLVKRKGGNTISDWNSIDQDDRDRLTAMYFLYYTSLLIVLTLIFLGIFENLPLNFDQPLKKAIFAFSDLAYDKGYSTLSNFISVPNLKLIVSLYISFKLTNATLSFSISTTLSVLANDNRNYMKRRREREEQERRELYLAKQEQEKIEARRKELQSIEENAYAKTRGESIALLSLYEGQLRLLQDHKRRGMDIERESFDLRKKLLELERQENNEMINDLLRTLDRI